MATASLEKVNEFLTCTVCTDEYSDPCTLKCQHTFCRKCITRYTKTRPEAVRSKTIPCPCCRQVMQVPDPTRPVDEWAWQVKPSIIILGLIDTSQPEGATTDRGRCCSVCEHIGETTQAKFWCPDCEVALCNRCTKAHRGTPASRDHELCDLSEEGKVKRQRKTMCREHTNNHIEFHCNDCKKSACQKCCILHHRSCKSLVTIESMKSEMKSVLDGKRQILTKQLKIKTDKVTEKKASVSKASHNKTANQSKIRLASQTAIDRIKQKEKQLLDKLDDVTEKQISQFKADVKTEEIEIQMYRQHWEFIDQTLKTESVMDMYDMYQACVSGAIVFGEDGRTDTTNERQIEEVRIIQDTDKLQSALANLPLEEIGVTYQDVSESLSSPVLNNMINIRIKNDARNPDVVDMTLLLVAGVQTAVVTDHSNECVKSFFTQSKKRCIDRLQLDKGPWGITQLKEREVMVSLPDVSKIITIEISRNLKLTSTINTGKGYYGLSVLNQASMAATSWNPDYSVDILNMTGQVMKSVQVSGLPWLICVNNKGNLLVSHSNYVACLSPEGNVIWSYLGRNLTDSRGITTTSTGSVLVADKQSKKVIQLTESGTFEQKVLTSSNHLETPTAVHYDGSGSLFVCDGRYVKQFRFI